MATLLYVPGCIKSEFVQQEKERKNLKRLAERARERETNCEKKSPTYVFRVGWHQAWGLKINF